MFCLGCIPADSRKSPSGSNGRLLKHGQVGRAPGLFHEVAPGSSSENSDQKTTLKDGERCVGEKLFKKYDGIQESKKSP